MSSEKRRDELIDIALEILRQGGVDQVRIGVVAEHANVTRALVYKHFSSATDLVDAAYSREAAKLHEIIRSKVNRARGLEERIRAFVEAALAAVDTHGWIFGSARQREFATNFQVSQNQRDMEAVRFFSQLASDEFGLSLRDTMSAMAILLTGVRSLRDQARILTTTKDRQFLADLYVDLVMGALAGLADQRGVKARERFADPPYLNYGKD